jgi:hypothetical protein
LTPRQRCGDLDRSLSARAGPGGGSGSDRQPAPWEVGARTDWQLAFMRSKRQTIEGAKEGVTAHLAADFPKNIAGDFTSKWRWVGIRKIKDHFAKKIGAEEFGDLWGRKRASALHRDKSRLCGDGNPTKWSAGWEWLLASGFARRRAGPSNALPRRHRHRRRFITRFQPHARMT